MLHRVSTAIVLGVALWYAMAALGAGPGVTLVIALLPLVAAVLNLLTGLVFGLAALVAVSVLVYVLAVDEPWFAGAGEAVRRLTAPR